MADKAFPIAIISFDRSEYLEATLGSLARQAKMDLSKRPVYLFQDGALNEHSAVAYCDAAVLQKNVTLFLSWFPKGTVVTAGSNLGVALNFARAEQFVFECLGADAAIFLEDDLVLGPYYISIVEWLLKAAMQNERMGYVAAYGNHRASRREQESRASDYIRMGHHWGFGLTRRQWLRQKPYVDQYLNIISTRDYRQRDHKRIAALFRSWGLGVPGTSQDVAKSHAAILTNAAKINTFACYARYIGRHGVHFSPRTFAALGFGSTYMLETDAFTPNLPSDAQLDTFLSEARKSAMQDHPALHNLVREDHVNQEQARSP